MMFTLAVNYLAAMLRSCSLRCPTLLLLLLAAASVLGQSAGQEPRLVHYVNDTLGFTMDLPCHPVAVPKAVGRGGAMVGCKGADPIIAISVEEREGLRDDEMEAVIRKEFQVDEPVMIERVRVSGHKARLVSFETEAFRSRSLVLVHHERMYLVMLMQRTSSTTALDTGILKSFRLTSR